jgi:hemolysin activation/secretion protein
LFRFGGTNSIRGFAENSLQGNFASILLTEYRYKVSNNLYINSIIDFAIYQDLTNTQNLNKLQKLSGVGIGTTIQTTSGLLRINLSNGGENLQEIKLFNTIVNIHYNVKF